MKMMLMKVGVLLVNYFGSKYLIIKIFVIYIEWINIQMKKLDLNM